MAAISACRPRAVAGDRLSLATVADCDLRVLDEDGEARALLERLVAERAGRRLRIDVLGAGALPGDEDTRNRAYREAQRHAVVRALIERFDGEIVAREPLRRPRA